MKRLLFFLVIFSIFFCAGSGALFSQSGSVGEIRFIEDVNDSIYFEIYDVSITGMKGKQVYFGFCLAQGNDWVKNTWVATESQTVGYSPAYWNGKACWFKYTYDLLESVSNRNQSYTGTFFIVNSANDDTIAYKDIPFNISGDSDTMSYSESSNSDYETETTDYSDEYSDESGLKTMMDYFSEASNRLVSFSGSNPLKKDPEIPGEWMSLIVGERSTYSVLILYMYLASDGSGVWEKNAFFLMTDGSLRFSEEDYAQYTIRWGVEVHYTEYNEPVTLLRITFDIDGSYMRLYYVYPEDNVITSVIYDEATQRASNETIAWRPKHVFLPDWEKNKTKVRDALYDAYVTDKECDQLYWDTMFMIEMSNHNTMMNIINNF